MLETLSAFEQFSFPVKLLLKTDQLWLVLSEHALLPPDKKYDSVFAEAKGGASDKKDLATDEH
jgi:hypothetical protein